MGIKLSETLGTAEQDFKIGVTQRGVGWDSLFQASLTRDTNTVFFLFAHHSFYFD